MEIFNDHATGHTDRPIITTAQTMRSDPVKDSVCKEISVIGQDCEVTIWRKFFKTESSCKKNGLEVMTLLFKNTIFSTMLPKTEADL